ncbi:MAG: glycine/sarcosine/betaine reductase component B subunit [Tissierellia bacterium]|nr:glycine/sarcosine/betaine reductase component B subunit [Tissierellia bacterium]
MRLEWQKISIDDVKFGDQLELQGKTLVINKDELIKELEEVPNVKSITVDLAKPGEKTRIIPVKDVIEPRYRVEKDNQGFPGVTSDVEPVGEGEVKILDGVAVVTIGDIVGFQEGVIDMWGEGAKWTPFSKTLNVVVDITPVEGLEPHEHETACRIVGLKAAEFLGKAAKDAKFDEVEVFDIDNMAKETEKYPDLPKVVYVEMLITQGLLHDSYIYGHDAKTMLPTMLHPNEELDGAVVSGNCVAACDKITTYQHQNNNVIRELHKIHGKEINFLGCVMVPENTTLDGKFRACDQAANLCYLVGADAVIISEEGYGNPDSDLVMICSRVEQKGIKSVLITDECSGNDGMSQPLTDTAQEAVAVVSTGNVSHIIELEKADVVLGDPEAIANLAGGWAGAYDAETGKMQCELNAVIGSTSEIGYHNATVELY